VALTLPDAETVTELVPATETVTDADALGMVLRLAETVIDLVASADAEIVRVAAMLGDGTVVCVMDIAGVMLGVLVPLTVIVAEPVVVIVKEGELEREREIEGEVDGNIVLEPDLETLLVGVLLCVVVPERVMVTDPDLVVVPLVVIPEGEGEGDAHMKEAAPPPPVPPGATPPLLARVNVAPPTPE
jgi:hypothetical protein